MIRSLALVGLVLLTAEVLLAVEPAIDQSSAVSIPLDEIFALNMPGTQDVRKLEPKLLPENLRKLPTEEQRVQLHEATISRIKKSLTEESPSWPRKDDAAKNGFVVSGTPLDALQASYAVLVDNEPRTTEFSSGDTLNLVFFSYSFADYVHIRSVNRNGNLIEVRYSIVPHPERFVSPNYAIVPLGVLPSGEYDVRMISSPLEQQYLNKGYREASEELKRRMICGSFSFDVEL